jgi:hypothetical protein
VPKQTYTLNDFSGGLNTVKDPRDIAPNELALAENIMVDEQGAIRTVGKWVDHAVVQDHAATLVGGYGIAILESDYETEPISITGSSNIDFAQLKDTYGSVVATTDTARYVTRAVNNSAMSVNTTPNPDILTVTTHTAHQITAGDSVEIRNTTSNYQEGLYTVLTVPSTTTYTAAATSTTVPSGGGAAFGATFHRLGLAIAASGGGMGFVEGSEILITGTSNNNGHYTVKSTAINNTQLIVQKDFASENNTSAVITSLPKEDYFLILSDADNGKIDTYSKNRDTWTADQITIDSTGGELVAKTKPVYYSVDNAIRASDANFDLGNNTRWFGYVKRTHFEGCTAEDKYLDWFEKDNKLSPPTDGAVGDTYPEDEAGFDLLILTPANSDSTWVAATYQVATSFIYDDNQESLLFIPSSSNTFAVAAGDSVTVSVHAHTSSTGYNPRISGGRVYARVSGSDESWFLLCDVDMRSGARATLDGDYIAWTNGNTAATDIDTGVVTSLFQNIDTYESLNGYNHDIESNSIGEEGEQWKSAVVANKRAFLAGVRRIDKSTGLHTTYGDRIYYSEAVRYDIFPSHNYIDVVLGDSESYVDIESFADRLLAFKQNSVQVINVASSTDTGWFLEENLKYHGIRHPAASTKTEYGIAWINDSGCYLYDGRRVRNLIDNKIDDDEWSDFIGITAAHISIIGYERHKKQLIIMKDCTGAVATGGDAYLYDFKTKSWVKLIDAFTDSVVYSNFVHDWDGNLVIAKENDPNVEFYTWDSDDVYGTTPIKFITKDIDFGDPNRTKKIYNVYVTYKANENLQDTGTNDIPLLYAKDGSTSFVNFDTCAVDGSSNTTYLPAAAPNWQVATFGISSIQSVQSLKLKLDVASASSKIHINDISIEYRPIHKRFT